MSDTRLKKPSQRARASSARVPDVLVSFQQTIRRRRAATADRFRQPSDWIRLVSLGVVLVGLSVLALANALLGSRFGYFPGTAAIFGGLFLGIITIRIARTKIYADWLAISLLEIGLGLLLGAMPSLSSGTAFAAFCLALLVLTMLRTWVGITLEAGDALRTLTAGGLAGTICVIWTILDRMTTPTVTPDVILSTDLILSGISILLFGLSVRKNTVA